MGKYQALGWGLAFAAFLLWMLAIYMPRDFVDVSEYANNIIWLGNGVGLGWVIWILEVNVNLLEFFGYCFAPFLCLTLATTFVVWYVKDNS